MPRTFEPDHLLTAIVEAFESDGYETVRDGDRTFARIETLGDDGSATMSEVNLSDIAMRAAQKLSHPKKFGDVA
ncbi:hypothetical protein [Agrobacterium tumefaciens]|uniref:hypothetical protein n=1 Tax=Agrobacterium tumefaciens TaxID=358 RepID=UPI00080FD8F6|nr:hypothetical protein [Agrobacterium tumefaciens]NSL22393.1 hypothetical protein [Agrobacterium tumefaciens]NTC57220.1 hypothetical protein [Agrobacterium tumefaciens]NTC62126.1 hypothetical protein [Agrobacterium tumefaciens]NTC65856.1 hypothetical protein [Agrobacterium tumefaciens]NTC74436.1 hypothetical protein [Agrobacterium tumefaciens]